MTFVSFSLCFKGKPKAQEEKTKTATAVYLIVTTLIEEPFKLSSAEGTRGNLEGVPESIKSS